MIVCADKKYHGFVLC